MNQKMLGDYAWDEAYRIKNAEDILTPALLVYPEKIAANIARAVAQLGGNADRWRVHIKTAKLGYTLRMLVKHGVRNFKCATTLELLEGLRSGANDVLLAYPAVAATARRVKEVAAEFPGRQVSVLIENVDQLHPWRGSSIGIFVDINPGMNRTGVDQTRREQVVRLAAAGGEAGLKFRGLHYYDGHYGALTEADRTAAAHAGYDQLLQLVAALESAGVEIPEVVTAGTPTTSSSLSYAGFRNRRFIHRVSAGTVVYNDATSLAQLGADDGYAPAVLVLSRVISHPSGAIVTCDAGHKSVSADAGLPTCLVVGHPELAPQSPSEEHLPLAVQSGASQPRIGDALYLLPRHICPTVNLFDAALIVRNGEIESLEPVSARGHEAPLLGEFERTAHRS